MNQNNPYPLANAYLNRIREADRKVEYLRMRIANLRLLTTDTAVHDSDTPHASSPDQQ